MSSEPAPIKPAYLMSGGDERKLSMALRRLRERAEREAGQGALEVFEAAGSSGPSHQALLASIPALSLIATRRYLLADGVEGWSAAAVAAVCEALASLPPDLTIVLIARGKASVKLANAVKKAGGDAIAFSLPNPRELPSILVRGATARGFELSPSAARMLVDRMGPRLGRLECELDRLALWAEPGGRVEPDDLSAMIRDTSEEVAWALGDAIVARRPGTALHAVERLIGQGEGTTGLVRLVANRLRNARLAAAGLAAGRSPAEVESSLQMHPYAAQMLVREVRNTTAEDLVEATIAFAELEYASRGGSNRPEQVAMTLAVRRAAGAGGAAESVAR